MKNLGPLLFSIIFLPITAMSQGLPNGGFEDWDKENYFMPGNGYTTSNPEARVTVGTNNVTRDNDNYNGSYSVRMETVANNSDTVFGYIAIGDPGDLSGGVPYSQNPDSLTGYYKCDVAAGDTALIAAFFKKNGALIGQTVKQFYGTKNSYTRFSVPVNLSMTPDTLIFAAASSNGISQMGITPGSWLKLDELRFQGSMITQHPPNKDFENWNSINYDEPWDWATLNPYLVNASSFSVFKSTSSYEGNYALRLEVVEAMGDTMGFMTSGRFGNNGMVGGRDYTKQVDTLSGYYKYSAGSGTDSGAVILNFRKGGSNIYSAVAYLEPASNYTYFELPFDVGVQPDTMRIDITASIRKKPGGVLHLDALEMSSSPLSVVDHSEKKRFNIYPNPARSLITLENHGSEIGKVRVLSSRGRVLKEYRDLQGRSSMILDVDDLPSGMYLIEVNKVNGERVVERMMIE